MFGQGWMKRFFRSSLGVDSSFQATGVIEGWVAWMSGDWDQEWVQERFASCCTKMSWTCASKECHTRSVFQEFLCKCVLQKCPADVTHKSVLKESLERV